MALPATGSTITMSQIRNYFSAGNSTIAIGTLGTYIGISVGNTISMSSVLVATISQYYHKRKQNENIIRSIKCRPCTRVY